MLSSELLQKYGLQLIQEKVGEGGSALVHKCSVVEQLIPSLPRKGTLVAVKEFRSEMLATPGQMIRIQQEAEIGEKVSSQHLAKIYTKDIGDGVPPSHCVLFMEWIDGPTLAQWQANKNPKKKPAWDFLRPICSQIVKGVLELHTAGINHRDIKPENIMLRSGTQPVIMDVGVAEIARGQEHTLHTRVKDFLGSVRYASPQFIRGEDFDSSDDVYSIGCTMLEIVTGLPPYHQHERKVTLPSVVLQGPPDIPKTVSDLASGLDVLIRGCVHPQRNRRPTLSELAEFFETGRLTEYITIERARQHGDDVGVPVLKVDGYDCFVDLGGAKPSITGTCKVIRLGQPLTLPSSGHTQITQRLIGNARLVHVHGSLAQYRFLPTVDSQANLNSVAYGLPQQKIEMVEVGDRVVL